MQNASTDIPHTPPAIQATLVIAAWFGLATGLLEGALYLLFQHLRWMAWDELLFSVGAEQIWISAVFNLLLFASIGVPVGAAARLLRGSRGTPCGARGLARRELLSFETIRLSRNDVPCRIRSTPHQLLSATGI